MEPTNVKQMDNHRSGSLSINYGDSEAIHKELMEAIVNLEPLERVERLYTRYVVAKTRNNVRSADILGVNRRTIQRWLKG